MWTLDARRLGNGNGAAAAEAGSFRVALVSESRMARNGPLRLLTKFFIRRFFDGEVLGPSVDGRLLLIALVPLLAAPGVAIPLFMSGGLGSTDPSTWGWSVVARELGPEALREISLSVKAQYVTFAMGLAALFCSLCWRMRYCPPRSITPQ